MASTVVLKRKSLFVDPRLIRRARRVLRTETDTEAIRRSLETVVEVDKLGRFLSRTHASVKRGSFE